MKAIEEEKLYWQKEAFKARDQVEQMAEAIRTANKDAAGVRERDKARYSRDEAAQKLIKALASAAGITLPAFNLPLATPEFVNRLVDDVATIVIKKAPPQHDYLHVAWYGHGGMYMDARQLNKEDNAKSKAIFKSDGKIKLYARVPAEHHTDVDGNE